jgi:hypothetical protein
MIAATFTKSSDSGSTVVLLIVGLVLCVYVIRRATKLSRRGRFASRSQVAQTKSGQVVTSAVIALGTVALGIALFVIGSLLKSHFALHAAICNTYGDTFGGSASTCVGNEGAYTAGQFMQPVGGLFFAAGIVGLIAVALGKHKTVTYKAVPTRERTSAVPTPRPTTPAPALGPTPRATSSSLDDTSYAPWTMREASTEPGTEQGFDT